MNKHKILKNTSFICSLTVFNNVYKTVCACDLKDDVSASVMFVCIVKFCIAVCVTGSIINTKNYFLPYLVGQDLTEHSEETGTTQCIKRDTWKRNTREKIK